ncbi:unnamed protein product [Mytilus coruscus]|uniref:Novel STAND NTPase 3 domain-containing protein n=1 Tax=Mytilus coruscus TaxID=42192 RepID=A0A6J8C4P7_MYTCO|nr:unnamed protein product [Mytilus coruscus]
MALSTSAKEEENFVRYAILIVDHSNEALQDLIELNLKKQTSYIPRLPEQLCEKEQEVKDVIKYLHFRPIDARLCSNYQNILLENYNRNETINENIKSEHTKTRNEISFKLMKLESEIQDLRTQFIGDTLAEIDNHRKDQTYTEIKAVTACVQMLDNSKVLILSGREGSGKSRNGLEILRQVKEKHPETEVIKLRRFTEFTDKIDRDKMTIVLFEDVFGRISKQICENADEQILDSVNSYINLGNVKNKKITILGAPFLRYPSKSLLQEIDNMRMEGIDNDVKGLKYVILVYILLNQAASAMSIKYDDHVMLSINENNIDVQSHQKLFNECYNKYFGLKLHDIIYLYEELTCRYLIRKEKKTYFQHRAVQDSILISYCKINPKAILPLLSIDYIEIVEWALKNSDHELFDEEELFHMTIHGYKVYEYVFRKCFYVGDICIGYSKILELLILQKPGILKCCKIDMLVEVANRNKWYGVLELLFKNDNNLSINTDQIIEDIFKHWDREEDESYIYHYDDAYCRKIVQLIMKYYLNYVKVNKIFEKACQFGIHGIVEELSLEKLDITLDNLRDQQLNEYDICFKTGHGRILMLLLPRLNYNIIDLNSVTNVVCLIGHSAAIQ